MTKIQINGTGKYLLLYILIAIFANCRSSSDKSKESEKDVLKSGLEDNLTTKSKGLQTSTEIKVTVMREQDPNGPYWGLRDMATGRLIVKYIYDKIDDFEDGFAKVLLNGQYGLINKKGKVLIEPSHIRENLKVNCGVIISEFESGEQSVSDTNGKTLVALNSVRGILPCQNRMLLENNGYGMLNFKNDTILPFKFREAYLVPEGFCIASNFATENLFGLYDLNGKQVLPHAFERINGFYCGRAIVVKNRRWGVIDGTGKELFYTDYGRIDSYLNNYAMVYTKSLGGESKVGLIDKTGRVVVPAIYERPEGTPVFSEGMVGMGQNRKYGFVNTSGKVVVSFKYNKLEAFQKGIAKVWVGWNQVGYINKTGKEIIHVNYDAMDQANLRRYYNKYIIGLKDAVQHVFDYSGKELTALSYSTIYEFDQNEKSFIVSINNKHGILDSNFRIKIPVDYDSLEPVFPGKIAARKNGKIGFINYNGSALSISKYDRIEPTYLERINEYENGLAKVWVKGKIGLINSYGKVIVPIIYEQIEGFAYGMAVVKRNGKYGYVNTRGKEVILAKYSKASAYDGYSAEVTVNGKTFRIDHSGIRAEEDID